MQLADSSIEIWRPIPGYQHYMASTEGRIMNRRSGHVLRPQPITSRYADQKYLQVGLALGRAGHSISKSVHRLVALTWLGPSNLPVDHISGNKHDCSVQNLRYCTQSENVRSALAMGLMPQLFAPTKLSSDDVLEIKRLRATGISAREIAARYGISLTHCYNVMAGRRRQKG